MDSRQMLRGSDLPTHFVKKQKLYDSPIQAKKV